MKLLIVTLMVALITGCASAPDANQFAGADCLVPVTETTDLGGQRLGCAYFYFGPSAEQRVKHKYHLFNYWGH